MQHIVGIVQKTSKKNPLNSEGSYQDAAVQCSDSESS